MRWNIRNARKYYGYTQESLSQIVGCTKDYYAKIERGKAMPNIVLGLTICKTLLLDPFETWL